MTQPGLHWKIAINIGLLLIIIIIGLMMHKKGHPYNQIASAIHKLATVAFIIIVAFMIAGFFKSQNPEVIFIIFLVLAGVAIISLFISGAMLSLDKLKYPMMWVHRAGSLGLLVSVCVLFYHLLSKS